MILFSLISIQAISMISAFDIFKIGIGPSSSHTVGPMRAGKTFCEDLVQKGLLERTTRVGADVYGSLSLTGHGHHTDQAILLGLEGFLPDTVPLERIPSIIEGIGRESFSSMEKERWNFRRIPAWSFIRSFFRSMRTE